MIVLSLGLWVVGRAEVKEFVCTLSNRLRISLFLGLTIVVGIEIERHLVAFAVGCISRALSSILSSGLVV